MSERIGLFSFDGPMYCDKDGVYCNTTITGEMFTRYFTVVDKLIVVIRTFHLEQTYIEAKLHKVSLPGLEFVEIPNLNSPKGFLYEKRKYQKIILQEVKKADLIFARMPSLISNMTIAAAKKCNKEYMVEVGGCAWDSYWNHGMLGKLIAPYMYIKEKIGVRDARYASYVTKQWLQKRYPNSGYQLVASNVYLPKANCEILAKRIKRIEKKVSKAPIVIGTIANVDVRYKGQEYIIQVIRKLRDLGYDFEYELVGAGNPAFLQSLTDKLGLTEHVRFKGRLLHDEVLVWLDSIDVYAQPSKQEGLPRALIEAMSRGCPSIGSTTAGIPELLNQKMIFSNGDINHICEILIDLTQNSETMIAEAERNYEESLQYEIETLNKKRTQFYNHYAMDVLSQE